MEGKAIFDVLSKDRYCSKIFGGIFAADQLKKIQISQLPVVFVLNTGKLKSGGIHWVALYINHYGTRGYFFDSFGFDPIVYKEIHKFIITNSLFYKFNQVCLQSPLDETCGLYCIYFCLYISRGYSMNYIINLFPNKKRCQMDTVRFMFYN